MKCIYIASFLVYMDLFIISKGDSLTSHYNNSSSVQISHTNMDSRNRRQITLKHSNDNQIDENIIFPKTQKVRKKELFFGILLPFKEADRGGNPAIIPAIQLAIDKVTAKHGILNGFNVTLAIRDTECSSVYGPLAAFDLYTKRKPGLEHKKIYHIQQ